MITWWQLKSHTSSSSFWRSPNWKDQVAIDKRYFTSTEVDNLKGDASKAKEEAESRVRAAGEDEGGVDEDLEMAKREKVLVDAGYIDATLSSNLNLHAAAGRRIIKAFPQQDVTFRGRKNCEGILENGIHPDR